MGVRVKPLVWIEDPDNDSDSCFWRAKAGDYIYEVGADLSYWWQLDGDISTCAIGGFKTPELAKAAAQADYEARIPSALIEDDGYVTVFPPLKQSEGGE